MEFLDIVFHGVDLESLLDEVEVSSLQTKIPVLKGYNFWPNRWITLKFSQEFPDSAFHGVDVESLLGEADVSSLQTRISVRKRHTFWSDRLIAIKFSQEFPDSVFCEVDFKTQLGEAVSRRSRPEYRFERTITFNQIVVSPSKF